MNNERSTAAAADPDLVPERFLSKSKLRGISIGLNVVCRVARIRSKAEARAMIWTVIRALSVRLDRVTIEHLDWQRCLELYDRPTTFFFLDPPYTECEVRMYGAWTNADVQILRDRLDQVRGKWLLTLNDTPAIRGIFDGCQVQAFSRPRGISNKAGGTAPAFKELLIQP